MSGKNINDYSLAELKLIYQVLHAQIPHNPALMDSDLLDDLQRYLQQQAAKDGVDVSLHAQWATWLNGSTRLKGIGN